mmetsp:Transcript_29638/g.67117  ORF Transcript_29638/g.67117 Transcript_29638/m.67117 type:complete len:895 (+) Transcript_29638:36-2720(+)|eukprot:CAMPEP_0204355856 /NCGR_PEP_ID=MMETSP0469-20131031/34481_1 /ASSEMBLY_ACC=CAM_ASM_000384 /TAXON_ID=2969 /ORGANISM="Oxyrrhis marina" /LENGTH=894 /DNA_ID=CAMNT_0051343199 /DNA_START=25 /DNA_END=2709 /DNA_ORIENTATION=+
MPQSVGFKVDNPEARARFRRNSMAANNGSDGPDPWDLVKTVSLRYADVKARSGRFPKTEVRGRVLQFIHKFDGWILAGVVGFLSAVSGCVITKGVNYVAKIRTGVPWSNWEPWADYFGIADENHMVGYAAYVMAAIVFASLSAFFVRQFAPKARGSGIPEVKTILGGFMMDEVLSAKTLAIKCLGLALSTGAGMSLGKEGPLVHVACCWANILSNFTVKYSHHEGKRREMLSAAAAAGVSTAFGAPLGGVLFSYEEVSTHFQQWVMWKAFFAAVIACVTLQAIDINHDHHLTEYTVKYDQYVALVEYIPFFFLGALSGIFGATFIALNTRYTRMRITEEYKKKVPIIFEVGAISAVTALSSYWFTFLNPIMSGVIHDCFESCNVNVTHSVEQMEQASSVGLCDPSGPQGLNMDSQLFFQLGVAAFLKLLQTSLTFGTGVPAGLFVPSLFMGAVMGRATGHFMAYINADVWTFSDQGVEPGIYAMVGAAAMLGGVCRVTISITVIMFELTGGLSYVVPFMVSILTAKVVGDTLNEGIYDSYIKIRKYPFLHDMDTAHPAFATQTIDHVMEDTVYSVPLYGNTVGSLLAHIDKYRFHGFPLLASKQHRILLGYLHADDVRAYLERLLKLGIAGCTETSPIVFKDIELKANPFVEIEEAKSPRNGRSPRPGRRGSGSRRGGRSLEVPRKVTSFRSVALAVWFMTRGRRFAGDGGERDVDLSELVDYTVHRLVPETHLEQVHKIFLTLGIRIVFVTRHGFLKGVLTKKNYLQYVADHHDDDENKAKEPLDRFHELARRKSTLRHIKNKKDMYPEVGAFSRNSLQAPLLANDIDIEEQGNDLSAPVIVQRPFVKMGDAPAGSAENEGSQQQRTYRRTLSSREDNSGAFADVLPGGRGLL